MRSDPGYPDDIRSYDDHPDSPFFVDKFATRIVECLVCQSMFEGDEEFFYITPTDDCEGVCDDCAIKPDVKLDWGFE